MQRDERNPGNELLVCILNANGVREFHPRVKPI